MQSQLESILKYLPHFGATTERLPIIDILHPENDNDDEEELGAAGSASRKSIPDRSRERDGACSDRNALRHPHIGIPGLRVFREVVRNDIDQIDKVCMTHFLTLSQVR